MIGRPGASARAGGRPPDGSVGQALVALAAALLLAGCQGEPRVRQSSLVRFGTIVQLDIAGTDAGQAQAGAAAIDALYARLESDWRSFGDGELGRANERLAAGEPVLLSPELHRLVARSLEIRDRSGGLFDPRVGTLVRLWGFEDLARRTPQAAPGAEALAAAREQARLASLRLENGRLSSDRPVRLELAGIAKGSALAAGAALLRARAIDQALVTIGGDVLAIGRRGARPWRIGVRDPFGAGIIGTIDLADGEAAVTSGTYERGFESGGRRYHHLLDPRTGRPAEGTVAVTVVGRDPELANAAAIALLVAGMGEAPELAATLGVDCVLMIGADGSRRLDDCMTRRLVTSPP